MIAQDERRSPRVDQPDRVITSLEPRKSLRRRRRPESSIADSSEMILTRSTKAIWVLMSGTALALSQLSKNIPRDDQRVVSALSDQLSILAVRFRLSRAGVDRLIILSSILRKVCAARRYIHQHQLTNTGDKETLRRAVLGLTRLQRYIDGIETKPYSHHRRTHGGPRPRDRSLIKPYRETPDRLLVQHS